MSLYALIAAIAELTDRLQEALAVDDLPACADLLAERGEALARLAAAVPAASRAEAAAAAPALRRLAARDEALRRRAGAALEAVGAELARRGAPAARTDEGGGICLDRRV